MNPLAQLATLIGGLCIFIILRIIEVATLAFYLVQWAAVPRWLEMVQVERSNSPYFQHDMANYWDNDEWYTTRFLSGAIGTKAMFHFANTIVYILCLPSYLGLVLPFSCVPVFNLSRHIALDVCTCSPHIHGERGSNFKSEARFSCLIATFYAIVDLVFSSILVPLGCLQPLRGDTRSRYFSAYCGYVEDICEATSIAAHKDLRTDTTRISHIMNITMKELADIWLQTFMFIVIGTMEMVIYVFGFACILLTPTRYKSNFLDFSCLIGDFITDRRLITQALAILESPSYKSDFSAYQKISELSEDYLLSLDTTYAIKLAAYCALLDGPSRYTYRMSIKSRIDDSYLGLMDKLCLIAFTELLVELVAIPATLVALISPIRSGKFRAEIAVQEKERLEKMRSMKEGEDSPENNQSILDLTAFSHALNERGYLSVTTRNSTVHRSACAGTSEYYATYFHRSIILRYTAIENGMYALFDVLVLPLMLPLIITQYRWGAISGYIYKHSAVSLELLGMIVTQTMCMTLDLIILFPISLILYVTRLRWRPLRDAYREINFVATFGKSCSIYATAFECFIRLLLDVFFLPGFILIQLTNYRSEKVNYLFAHPYEFHTSKYFYFLFVNTVMVVLDIIIISPIVIVTIVLSGGLRAEAMYRLLQMCSVDTTVPTDHEPALNPCKWLGDSHPAGIRMEENVQEEAPTGGPLPASTNEFSRTSFSGQLKSGEAPVGMEEERSEETSMSTTSKLIVDGATSEVTDGDDEVYNMFWECGFIPRYQKPDCGQGPLSFRDWKNERYERETTLTGMLVFPASATQARFAMLQQFSYAVFDTFFIGVAIVVILSLWRAQKVINYYVANRERRRVHYNSVFMERHFIDRPPGPNGYISPTFEHLRANLEYAEENITGWNVLIMTQFVSLMLDVLALPAFAVVAGTLYRLPALLLELAARAGTAALSKRPLFKLTRLKFMFPRNGGPKMTMRMMYNTTPSAEDDATVLRDDAGNIRLPQRMNIVGPVKVYVSDLVEHEGDGLGFWQEVRNEYGSTLASVGEAMLPLKLKDGTGVELTEFQVALEELLFLNTQPGHTNHEIEMVANIDAGNTKRATFAKKLSKLTKRFSLQFQAACSIDGAKAEDEVLFRMTLDPGVLSSAISGDVTGLEISDATSTSTTATAGALVEIPMDGKFTSEGDGAFAFSSTSEPLAGTQQHLEGGIAPREDAHNECSRDNGLVDSFLPTVLMRCGQVIDDLAHLLLLLVTFITPWRLFELLMDLGGPVHLATHRKVVRAQELLDIAEQYLFDYYRALMPRFNSLSKTRAEWDGGLPGTSKMNTSYWRYNLGYHPPMLAFSDSDMKQDEALSITPYVHLTKEARKLLEDIDEEIPGVTRLLALHEETATLHDQLISIPALKATMYSYALANADDEFWSNGVDSREHNIIDTLLNTRTSVNRSIMVQNRRSTRETIDAIRAGCELVQKRKERAKKITEYRMRNGIVDDTGGGVVIADVAAESEDGYWVVDGKEVRTKSVSTLRGGKLADTKKLVRAAATNAWLDILYISMAFFMFVCVVRFLPLLTDLCSIGTWNPGHYKVKFYIRKHVKIMADDFMQLLRFFFLLAVVAATVFALPTTLLELPQHMGSLRDANDYLEHNIKNLCYYICTLFIECCQCQTVWSVLNLGLFAGLTPGICLSDTLFPRPAAEEEQMIKETIDEENEWARKLRRREDIKPSERKRHSADDEKKLLVPFFLGCAIWAGLAFAAGWGTKLAMGAGDGTNEARETASSNYFALVTYCTVAGLIVCVVFYSWNRKTLWQPVMLNNAKLNPFPSLTSSHVSAIITGPMEALQLSAIVCYFLWPTTDSEGQATWAARLLLWGDYSSSFSYHTSMNVAIAMGLGWLVVVTLPALIVGGNTSNPCDEDCCECGSSDGCGSCCGCEHYEYDKSLSVNQKANRVRSSPAFSLAYQLINRVFNVYFIATLLRPLSCMVVDAPDGSSSSSGSVASSVITTTVRYAFGDAQNVEDLSERASDVITCGGDGHFASTVSGVCLMYYVVTTLCTHADDGDSFSVSLVDISTQCYVRFCPSYAMILRALQMGSVVLVMLGAPLYSSTTGSQSILLVLGALALLMALVPLILFLRGVSTCSSESITPFRVFSSLSFMWTCLICYMRHAQPSTAFGGTDSTWYLLAGWGILLLVGASLSCVHYLGVVSAWRKEFYSTPLYVAVEKLFSASTDNSLTLQEREEAAFIRDSSSNKAAGAAGKGGNAGESDSAFEARAYSLAAVRAGLPEARKQALMKEAENATSIARLAVVVAKFEDRILTERLDPAFLLYRDQWKKKLLNLDVYQNASFASTEIGSRLESMWTSQSMANKSELMVELCTELCKAVIPPTHLLSTSQTTLQAIFARKRIPLDCSYIILSYLVDTTKVKAGLLPQIEESLKISGHLYTSSRADSGTITKEVVSRSMRHATALLALATDMTNAKQGNNYRFETTPMQAFLQYEDDHRDIGRLLTYDGSGGTLPEYPADRGSLFFDNSVSVPIQLSHERHNSL